MFEFFLIHYFVGGEKEMLELRTHQSQFNTVRGVLNKHGFLSNYLFVYMNIVIVRVLSWNVVMAYFATNSDAFVGLLHVYGI